MESLPLPTFLHVCTHTHSHVHAGTSLPQTLFWPPDLLLKGSQRTLYNVTPGAFAQLDPRLKSRLLRAAACSGLPGSIALLSQMKLNDFSAPKHQSGATDTLSHTLTTYSQEPLNLALISLGDLGVYS